MASNYSHFSESSDDERRLTRPSRRWLRNLAWMFGKKTNESRIIPSNSAMPTINSLPPHIRNVQEEIRFNEQINDREIASPSPSTRTTQLLSQRTGSPGAERQKHLGLASYPSDQPPDDDQYLQAPTQAQQDTEASLHLLSMSQVDSAQAPTPKRRLNPVGRVPQPEYGTLNTNRASAIGETYAAGRIVHDMPDHYDMSHVDGGSSWWSTLSSSSSSELLKLEVLIGLEEETLSRNHKRFEDLAGRPEFGKQESLEGVPCLQSASILLSTRLTYGQVLYAQALASEGDHVGKLEVKKVAVINGLLNDEWSSHAAASYPNVIFHNLCPHPPQRVTSFPNYDPIQYSPYIPNVPSALLRRFPLESGSVESVVYRLPRAAPERYHKHIFSEARRVLTPDGYLEMLVLEKVHKSSQASCKGSKLTAWASNESLKRIASDVGFGEVKLEPLRVPRSCQLFPSLDNTATLKMGLTTTDVCNFWYNQCYKTVSGCCHCSISLKVLVCRNSK